MPGESSESPSSPMPPDAVKEVDQSIPEQSIGQRAANLFRREMKTIAKIIGSGEAREVLDPGSRTKRQLLEQHLSKKEPPPKATEPSEP